MELIAAIIFMLGAGIYIFVGAFAYGIIKVSLTLLVVFISLIVNGITDPEILLKFESYIRLLEIPSEFFQPFLDFFSKSWNWARYENPFFAFVIGVFLLSLDSYIIGE